MYLYELRPIEYEQNSTVFFELVFSLFEIKFYHINCFYAYILAINISSEKWSNKIIKNSKLKIELIFFHLDQVNKTVNF